MWSTINWQESNTSNWYSSLIPKFYWLNICCCCKGTSMLQAAIDFLLIFCPKGFDTITWGYCKQQGVTDSVLGALTGVSALVGVLGAR